MEPGPGLGPKDHFPVVVLFVLLAVTALWWAFALWPLPSEAPAWLERARYVCFNATDGGLPDASGWVLLVGQPLGMLALLLVGWGRRTRDALVRFTATPGGRGAAAIAVVGIALGAAGAGARVLSARPAPHDATGAAPSVRRLDRPWPGLAGLVDQHGRAFSPSLLGGRPALVTFAFAHCETVCPLVVQGALAARDSVSPHVDASVVVITLDPWRDTPLRLPAMAASWGLGPVDLALSGEVERVQAVLAEWGTGGVRDQRTGDVVHAALVYVVRADGTVVYTSTGSPAGLAGLLREVASAP